MSAIVIIDRRKFSDRFTELLPLFRVLDAGLHNALHRAQMAGENADVLPFHRGGKDGLPAELLAELRRELDSWRR